MIKEHRERYSPETVVFQLQQLLLLSNSFCNSFPPPSLAAKNDYCRLYLILIVGSFPAKELNVEILSTGLSIRVETKNQFKRWKFEMKVDAVRVVL
jgi:hypothetical protein